MPTVRGGRLPWWAMSTPLVDWLRAQDDDTLADLLRLRPDLAVPPPADLTVLATRAGIRASVHRACDDLDTVALHVLDALVVADADTAPVAPADVRRLFGPGLPPAVLDAALAALRARALAWDAVDPDTSGAEWAGIALVPAVRDVISRFPGGLGRPAAGVAASSALPELLAAVDPDERRVLETLAAGPPVGRSRGAGPANPVSRLLARGLLVRVDAETVELPRQVGLALRGDRPLGALALGPPDLATVRPRRGHGGRHRGGRRAAGAAPGRAAGRVLGDGAPAGAAFGRPRCAGAAAGGSRGRRRRGHGRAARRDRRGGGPGRRERRRRARVGADDPGRRLGGRRPGAEVGGAGPRLARPAARAGARRHPGRRRAADRRAVRRPAPSDGPPRPAPGARRPRRAAAGNGRGDLRSARRPAGVAGAAAGRAAARRGRAVDPGRGDGAGRRRARRALDAGPDAARPSRRAPPPRCALPCPTPSTTSCSRPT